MREMTDKELLGIATQIGLVPAIYLAEFTSGLEGLTDEQRNVLILACMGLDAMPADASLEKRQVLVAIESLRGAWRELNELKTVSPGKIDTIDTDDVT